MPHHIATGVGADSPAQACKPDGLYTSLTALVVSERHLPRAFRLQGYDLSIAGTRSPPWPPRPQARTPRAKSQSPSPSSAVFLANAIQLIPASSACIVAHKSLQLLFLLPVDLAGPRVLFRFLAFVGVASSCCPWRLHQRGSVSQSRANAPP